MPRRRRWIRILAVGVLSLGSAVMPSTSPGADTPISATVGPDTTGSPMAPGFVGVSLEYNATHFYTGRDPRAINPVLVQLLRALAPGQSPVLRIGGNSADATWWPMRGVIPPAGIRYALTPGWLRTTSALASALGAHLIMGVNLAGGRPAIATAEARAMLRGIGSRYVQAFEIGNEPDIYNVFPWYIARRGRAVFARGHRYNLGTFTREFSRWRAALPNLPVAGPAFAQLTWLSGLTRFIDAEPGLKVITVHRYPMRAGTTDPNSSLFSSIPNLMADTASSGLAQKVAPYVTSAHALGELFRVDEMNSASHFGQRGVSDTFASALWVLDTLFNLASVGVDGVNVHSLPGAAYELFSFKRTFGRWQAFVHPEYYGMLLFAQAFPPGAQLLSTTAPTGPVKIWATRAPDGHTRVVLINKDATTSYQVQVQLPGASTAAVERLQAPSISATSGVTLGGQGFGSSTVTGSLPAPQTEPVTASAGTYSVELPAASAAMLTQ